MEWEGSVAVLRIVDRRLHDRRQLTVSWVDGSPLTHEIAVDLPVDGLESEKVRWYLEDYAEFPAEPAPAIARDAEALLARVGRQLFERVFAERGATRVWTKVEDDLAGVRVEIDTDPSDVPGVPWELLRDPDSNQAVALGAAQFVRTHHQTARAVALPEPTAEPLRVLLVICRPGGADDVPFRSVASRLVRSGVDRLPGLSFEGCGRRRSPSSRRCSGPRRRRAGRITSCTSTGTARSSMRPRSTTRSRCRR
jgi:hypothetical protein